MELYTRAAELGCSKAHCYLGNIHYKAGDKNKAKFHFEAAAMAEHEMARSNLGGLECNSGNMERAVKHWKIAASGGEYRAMHYLITSAKRGHISRDAINLTLSAYNDSCAKMRSEARVVYPIRNGLNSDINDNYPHGIN
jgi:TPR repeat protein